MSIKTRWLRFWMRFAGLTPGGRFATRLATWLAPDYKYRCLLSNMNAMGYISPEAAICINPSDLKIGGNVFVGDRCVFHQNTNPGPGGAKGGTIEFGKKVQLYSDIIIEIGYGGHLVIGDETHIQPRCQLSAYVGNLIIGSGVEIAANCAFYTYNHGIELSEPVRKQPCFTKGGIKIGDEAWLGVGVIVLDGVKISNGAVVGAGSVVTKDIPEGAIAFGNPAQVVRKRD